MAKKKGTPAPNGHANGHGSNGASKPKKAKKKKYRTHKAPLHLRPSEGRPTIYSPQVAEVTEKLCGMGATNQEIADFFRVSTGTIWQWKLAHPEFSSALKSGKEQADERVKNSLYSRAVGYTFEAEKIFFRTDDKEPVRVRVLEHVPPDPTSCIFWLKNRLPHEWRDRREFVDSTPPDPEAEARRYEAINTMNRLIEERARMGLPPIFPANRRLATTVVEVKPRALAAEPSAATPPLKVTGETK